MRLTDKTIQELRQMTKAQIIAAIADYLQASYTRREIIRGIRNDRDTETETAYTYDAQGRITGQTDIERDDDTQAQVSKRVITWTYYATGEVNVIKTELYDAADVLIRTRRIKHYRDGRQPEVS